MLVPMKSLVSFLPYLQIAVAAVLVTCLSSYREPVHKSAVLLADRTIGARHIILAAASKKGFLSALS